ncbi:MAG TPA: DUF3017 domain-containing protein [Cellulomonas sp.]
MSQATPTTPDPLDDPDARFGPDGQPLDPRAIARASLDAGRNASLWVVAVGVLASVAVAVAFGTPAGVLTMAALLACSAVVRGVVRGPGPAALVVRRRAVDVTILAGLALALVVLVQLLPPSAS